MTYCIRRGVSFIFIYYMHIERIISTISFKIFSVGLLYQSLREETATLQHKDITTATGIISY